MKDFWKKLTEYGSDEVKKDFIKSYINYDFNNNTKNIINKENIKLSEINHQLDKLNIDDEAEKNELYSIKNTESKNQTNTLETNNSGDKNTKIVKIHDELQKFKNAPISKKIKNNKNKFTYNNRIFVLDKKLSKYKAKKGNRLVYKCKNWRKNEKERRKYKEGPFCNMKIYYYKDEGNFEIIGDHSDLCKSYYNDIKIEDNKEIIDDWEKYKLQCIKEFEKHDYYKKNIFINLCENIYNNNYSWHFKYTKNRINNLISNWKAKTVKFIIKV